MNMEILVHYSSAQALYLKVVLHQYASVLTSKFRMRGFRETGPSAYVGEFNLICTAISICIPVPRRFGYLARLAAAPFGDLVPTHSGRSGTSAEVEPDAKPRASRLSGRT